MDFDIDIYIYIYILKISSSNFFITSIMKLIQRKIIFLFFRYLKQISIFINNKLNSSRNVIIHREVNVLRLSLILIPTSVPLLPLLKQRLVSTAGQSANSTVPIYSKYMKTSGKRAKHAGRGFVLGSTAIPFQTLHALLTFLTWYFSYFTGS